MGAVLINRLHPSLSPASSNAAALQATASFSSELKLYEQKNIKKKYEEKTFSKVLKSDIM